MQDYSRTEKAVRVSNASISCVYKVIGGNRYNFVRKADEKYVGNIAIRTFDGVGELYFWSGERFELRENSLLAVPSDKIMKYRTAHGKWCFWWFEYNNGGDLLPEERVLFFDFQKKEEELSLSALDTLREKSPIACEEASAYFNLLLCLWRRYTSESESGALPAKLGELVKRIRSNPGEVYTLESMATEFYLSPRSFRDYFERYVGLAPKKFLIKIRMEYAYELLTYTTLTVAEVAQCCGYEDRFYFSRAFSDYWNIPPSSLRHNK